MKKALPFWLLSALLYLLALTPTYPYLRLIPAGFATVIALYQALSLLRARCPALAHGLRSLLTTLVILGITLGIVTGSQILLAGAQPPPEDAPYIIVLGAKADQDGPSATLQERIDAAWDYLTARPDTIAIVSGGKGADEPTSEAQCMYDALTARGIAPARIWIEDQATSTWENIRYSLDLIEGKTGTRPTTIAVVTSEFHLYRTQRHCLDRGITVQGIPATTQEPDRYLHYFIREIAGIWHYLILGGTYR